MDFQPEIQLHPTDIKFHLQDPLQIKEEISLPDVQQLSLPELPQIKEEDLWTSQGEEQLQQLQSDSTDSIFTSPKVESHCDPENPPQLPPLYQIATVENRERDSLFFNIIEVKIKEEPEEEQYRAPEPADDSQPSATPHCPTAQSLEREEERGQVSELKLSIISRQTQSKCSEPTSSPGPSPWTRPITGSCSSDSEDVSCEESESNTADNLYQCDKCEKIFSEKRQLRRHRKVHTSENFRYKCEGCDQAFIEKYNLERHSRIHTGEKPFTCEDCGKSFRLQKALVRHRIIHTGAKPYQCPECDKAFNQTSNLLRHRRSHTGEKPFKCEKCDKAFGDLSHLITHRNIHTGGKRYGCEVCYETFKQKSTLVTHRRIHTGERPYPCEDCDKAFITKSELGNHRRRMHTEKKPYVRDATKLLLKSTI